MSLKLYGYWRSSATYRVRIALNLKELEYEYVPVHLVKDGGQQHQAHYVGLNPAHLVPTLLDDDEDFILNQSMAIIEYLDERYPNINPLLSKHRLDRARIRTVAQDIACDAQPLANLRVLNHIEQTYQADADSKAAWAKHWIELGLQSVEKRIKTTAGKYCFGFDLSMADICLVPHVYNAHRFSVDMKPYPLITKIVEHCNELPAFISALPENQPDAT